MSSRFRLVALASVAVVLSLTAGGIAVAARSSHHHVFRGKRSILTAAQVRRLSAGATHHSIIIFKNQLSNLPARPGRSARARASAASATQSRVRAELAAVHASHVRSFQLINPDAATISSAEIKHLQANPAVRAVVPDSFRHFASLGSGPGPALPAGPNAPSSQQICPSNPAQPLIEPEARQVMNVDAAEQIADGTGVKVGIIADGIDPNNPDLIRANGQHVIFDYEDFSGFGPGAPTDGR